MSDNEADDAVAWAVRVSDLEFTDWDAFDAWLAGDPARGPAYMDATIAVEELAAAMTAFPSRPAGLPPVSAELGEIVPLRSRARWTTGGAWRGSLSAAALALAAGIAGFFFLGQAETARRLRIIETPLGQAARITLTDGSQIVVAGASRLTLDPDSPREVTVERGRAIFTVTHDPGSPFRVAAGSHRIVDVGTVFEIVRIAGTTNVAVAEGAVTVDPARTPIALDAGEGAVLHDDRPAELFFRAPMSIGQWSKDRMSYGGAPLTQVAADLSGALGRPIMVDPGIGRRRFTGSLAVAPIRARPQELAVLLDVRMHRDGDGWKLTGR